MPAAFIVAGLVALLRLPPFQTMVLPALVPVKVEVFTVQDKSLLLFAVTVTAAELPVTVTVAVLLHPLPVLAVTV